MGASCCCLRNDYEDFTAQNTTVCRNCIFIPGLLQNFVHMYASYFHGGEQHVLVSSGISMGSLDNSLVDMFRAPPRPIPYDADPRFPTEREKGSSHSHEETEPFRMSEVDEHESLSTKRKWNQMKLNAIKSTEEYSNIYTSSEDEDICPTCLDEYTLENPKIITECAHHFHLGCIYEWMERSDRCPVCCKVMAFNEAN